MFVWSQTAEYKINMSCYDFSLLLVSFFFFLFFKTKSNLLLHCIINNMLYNQRRRVSRIVECVIFLVSECWIEINSSCHDVCFTVWCIYHYDTFTLRLSYHILVRSYFLLPFGVVVLFSRYGCILTDLITFDKSYIFFFFSVNLHN